MAAESRKLTLDTILSMEDPVISPYIERWDDCLDDSGNIETLVFLMASTNPTKATKPEMMYHKCANFKEWVRDIGSVFGYTVRDLVDVFAYLSDGYRPLLALIKADLKSAQSPASNLCVLNKYSVLSTKNPVVRPYVVDWSVCLTREETRNVISAMGDDPHILRTSMSTSTLSQWVYEVGESVGCTVGNLLAALEYNDPYKTNSIYSKLADLIRENIRNPLSVPSPSKCSPSSIDDLINPSSEKSNRHFNANLGIKLNSPFIRCYVNKWDGALSLSNMEHIIDGIFSKGKLDTLCRRSLYRLIDFNESRSPPFEFPTIRDLIRCLSHNWNPNAAAVVEMIKLDIESIDRNLLSDGTSASSSSSTTTPPVVNPTTKTSLLLDMNTVPSASNPIHKKYLKKWGSHLVKQTAVITLIKMALLVKFLPLELERPSLYKMYKHVGERQHRLPTVARLVGYLLEIGNSECLSLVSLIYSDMEDFIRIARASSTSSSSSSSSIPVVPSQTSSSSSCKAEDGSRLSYATSLDMIPFEPFERYLRAWSEVIPAETAKFAVTKTLERRTTNYNPSLSPPSSLFHLLFSASVCGFSMFLCLRDFIWALELAIIWPAHFMPALNLAVMIKKDIFFAHACDLHNEEPEDTLRRKSRAPLMSKNSLLDPENETLILFLSELDSKFKADILEGLRKSNLFLALKDHVEVLYNCQRLLDLLFFNATLIPQCYPSEPRYPTIAKFYWTLRGCQHCSMPTIDIDLAEYLRWTILKNGDVGVHNDRYRCRNIYPPTRAQYYHDDEADPLTGLYPLHTRSVEQQVLGNLEERINQLEERPQVIQHINEVDPSDMPPLEPNILDDDLPPRVETETPTQTNESDEKSNHECVICCAASIQVAFTCGHTCICLTCLNGLPKPLKCIICRRTDITAIKLIFS